MQKNTDIAENSGFWFRDLSAIFILFVILYLGLSFTRPLASPDEGRYVEIPREMVATGDLVTPRLNGMPYFYKPPMFYWMQAAVIKTVGINRVSARAANSIMAVLGILIPLYCLNRSSQSVMRTVADVKSIMEHSATTSVFSPKSTTFVMVAF